MILLVEHTNTVDGRPNYDWVRRFKQRLPFPSPRRLARVAKSLCCLVGARGDVRTDPHSGFYTFRPWGRSEVVIAYLVNDDANLDELGFGFDGESQEDLTATV